MSETSARKLGQLISQWYDAAADRFRPVSKAYPLPIDTNDAASVALTGMFNNKAAMLVHILGARSAGWTGTSVFGDLCEYLDTTQQLLNTPTAGQTLYMVSTSANDASAGSGSRTVRVTYLDSNGLQQATTVTLNGTTPVSMGTGFTSIQWMEVATNGSVGATSAGDIAVTSTNGAATVATTFELIKAGGNRSLSGRYKIPSDSVGYLIDWHIAAISATMDMRLRGDFFTHVYTITPGVFHFLERSFLASGANSGGDLHYRKCPSNAVIKVSAIPGSAPAGNKADCDFALIVTKA